MKEHQVFLSYSTKDAVFAEKLYDELAERGLDCWMAPRSIAPGSEYGEAIIAGIEQAKVFVLIYSEHSNRSQHVLREVERCVNKNTPFIAYKIGEVEPTKSMEYFLMANQWLSAEDNPEGHIEELYDAVTRLIFGAREDARNKAAGGIGTASEAAADRNFLEAAKQGRTREGAGEAQVEPKAEKSFGAAGKGTADNAGGAGKRHGLKKVIVAVGALAVAAVIFCVRNVQPGGRDVPDEVSGKLPEQVGDDAGSRDLGEGAPGGTGNPETEGGQGAEAQSGEPLSIKAGEYITFGRYYPQGQEDLEDAGIRWIVLSVDEKAGTALLLTEKLIDMKPYDVAESGVYGYGATGMPYDAEKTENGEYSGSALSVYFGDNSWEYSNLRAWLNSSDSVVSYKGQKPVSKGTDDGVNGYQNQAGFLYDFTKEELARLVTTSVETEEHSIGEVGVTQDRVFLLSVEEAERYLDGQKISRYAAPTDAAIAASRGTIYPLYHSYSQETIPWYFRTPAPDSSHEIMLCGSGFTGEADVITKNACSAGSGIRPAIVVQLSEGELFGEGTRISPYRITEN